MTVAHIAEVNHWRGQCLDNFARVECAVIDFVERWRTAAPATAPKLAETASARSRNVVTSLRKHALNDPKAKQALKLLELWSHRERDRNDLVHGIFTVKSAGGSWTLINRTTLVKSQVITARDDLRSAAEAEAFLKAIIGERKEIEGALSGIQSFA